MPEIVERDGKFCLEGYGDADACYDSRDEADAARAKLSGYEKKETPSMAELAQIVQNANATIEKALPPPEEATTDDAAPNDTTAEEAPAEEEGDAPITAVVDVPPSIRQLVLRIGGQMADVAAETAKALGIGRRDDEATGFKVQGNHWMAVWSNNFKDRDGELFPESAIDAYVSRVDKGVVKLPELWVWHGGKDTAIGSADWVARHGHFLMAAGQFYGSAPAQSAKAYYARHAKDTGISHGFTFPASQFDGKHYRQFNTFEISLLPRGTEANWYTSLEGVKDMAVDGKKLDYFKEAFGEEHATRILADWDKRGKALEELGVEFKDFAQTDTPAEANKQAVSNADKAFGDLMIEVLESTSIPAEAALEAVKAAKATNARVEAFEARMKALEDAIGQRPRASLAQETEVTASHLSPALQASLKEQNTVKDEFWGLDVVKTP